MHQSIEQDEDEVEEALEEYEHLRDRLEQEKVADKEWRRMQREDRDLIDHLAKVDWDEATAVERETEEFGLEGFYNTKSAISIGRLIGLKGLGFEGSCQSQINSDIGKLKWGDVTVGTKEGGLKDLKESMEESELKIPRMVEMVRASRELLDKMNEEDSLHLQTEGLAHARATVEEATQYLKHLDRRVLDGKDGDELEGLLDDETEVPGEFDFAAQERLLVHERKQADKRDIMAMHAKVLTPADVAANAKFFRDVAYVKEKGKTLIKELQRKIKGLNLERVGLRASRSPRRAGEASMRDLTGGDREGGLLERIFVKVHVIEAESLPLLDAFKKNTTDAYVKMTLIDDEEELLSDGVCCTSVAWESKVPRWGEWFEFFIPQGTQSATLDFNVFAVDVGGYTDLNEDMRLGSVRVQVVKSGHRLLPVGKSDEVAHLLQDEDGENVKCNGGQFMGRNSVLRLVIELTTKGGLSKRESATLLQSNMRMMLARRRFGRAKIDRRGLLDRNSQHLVQLARAEGFWAKYCEACAERDTPALTCLKKQVSGSIVTLHRVAVSLTAAQALGRLLSQMTYQRQLRELDLSYNQMNAHCVVALAEVFIETGSMIDTLESLTIRGNQICQEHGSSARPYHPTKNRLGSGLSGVLAVVRLVEASNGLLFLNLAENRMGEAALAVVCEALEANNSLQMVNLADNNGPTPGNMTRAAAALGKSLAANDAIEELDISGNAFGATDALAIFGDEGKWRHQGLQHNFSLRRLFAARNGLGKTKACVRSVARYIGHKDCALSVLDLADNHIDKDGALTLATGIGTNASLRLLVLDRNLIRATGVRAIMACHETKGSTKAVVMDDLKEDLTLEDDGPPDLRNRDKVREHFARFDEDHSNHMDEIELLRFSREIGLDWTEKRAAAAFAEMDSDHSGSVEFAEFYSWLIKNLDAEQEEKLLQLSLQDCGLFIQSNEEDDFDVTDPVGDYDLNLEEPKSHEIMHALFALNKQEKGEFVGLSKQQFSKKSGEVEYLPLKLSEFVAAREAQDGGPDEARQAETLSLPSKGRIKFKFGNTRGPPTADDAASEFVMKSLRGGISEGKTLKYRNQLLDAVVSTDTFFGLEQADDILQTLTDASVGDKTRMDTLSEEKVGFAVRVYHKLIDKDNAKILDYLSARERGQAELQLGQAALMFQPNNPTGFYRLRLGKLAEREVVLRLMELRNSLGGWLSEVHHHYMGARKGGRRARIDRVWRNAICNGKRVEYSTTWKPPYQGTFELDFVHAKRPDSMNARTIAPDLFTELLFDLQDETKTFEERILILRRSTNLNMFTCLHGLCILESFPSSKDDRGFHKVEVLVSLYSRIVDWRAFGRLTSHLYLDERELLMHRLGRVNLWYDEVVSPLGYWRLDLSKQEDHWVAQELVYLAMIEPGANMMECTLNGIDFDIPVAWGKEVPKRDTLTMYYAREAATNDRCMLHGNYDYRPLLGEPAKTSFPPIFLQPHIPVDFDARNRGFNKTWLYYEKVRRIMEVLSDKYSNAEQTFDAIDEDGGGTVERREFVKALFKLGVWLPPRDGENLLHVMDVDNSGEIDKEEFQNFWKNTPPLRYGDQEQRDYWSKRREHTANDQEMYDMAVTNQDLRASYPQTQLMEHDMVDPFKTHLPKGFKSDGSSLVVATLSMTPSGVRPLVPPSGETRNDEFSQQAHVDRAHRSMSAFSRGKNTLQKKKTVSMDPGLLDSPFLGQKPLHF